MLTYPEIEVSVISSIVYDNGVYFEHSISPAYFTGTNTTVFLAVKKILDQNGAVDYPELFSELNGNVEISYISKIIDSPISGSMEYSLNKLKIASELREIYKGLCVGIDLCKNFENPAKIESEVKKAFVESFSDEIAAPDFDSYHKTVSEITYGKRKLGLQTGIQALDNEVGGFDKAELILIAGRPGTGKTALACNIVRNFCYFEYPGLFISLEMTKEQLINRFACDIQNIDGSLIFKGQSAYLKKEDKQPFIENVNKAYDKLSRWPITIDDRPNTTIDDIYARARKEKMINKIEWLVIDHSREIKGWNEKGQEPKSEIISACKAIAKELDIPVILLSQLNRKIEDRENYIPRNSDLKDTGALEEKADLILFPDVFEREGFTSGNGYKNSCIYITKTRRGNIGKVDGLKWQGHYFRYSDLR